MDEKEFERKEKARLDEMWDDICSNALNHDCCEEEEKTNYQVTLTEYETQFAEAFTRLIKAGYEKDAKTILKYKYEKENT
jgi:hypothetical protein